MAAPTFLFLKDETYEHMTNAWGIDPLDSHEDKAPFKLSGSFLERFQGKQPKWGPLGYITYKRTYARELPEGGYEEFWQTLRRVVEGTYRIQQRHCQSLRLPWNKRKAQKSAQEMFERAWAFKWLPPGRGLSVMGTSIIEKLGSGALNNCGYVSSQDIAEDFAEPFCFLMDMSMLGVGIGGDTRGAGTVTLQAPVISEDVYVVEDSREGWVESLRVTLNAFVGKNKLPSAYDFSKVRPKGEKIKGFGGVASGPGPLDEMLTVVRAILTKCIDKPVSSTAIVDVFNVVGKCVVAGGVRRSSEILYGDPNDQEFMDLKNPELHPEELRSHRWASNNSIFAEVGQDYTSAAERIARNGEPGFQWMKNAQDYSRMGRAPDYKDHMARGANPCNEQTLEDRELCTLVETFPANCDDLEDYKRTLKFAYLYAKTVTLVPTHQPRTNAVLLRNRRIGTSQAGITQSFQKIGIRQHFQWCDDGYKYLDVLDLEYSRWLCVPVSIKKTSIKPGGTIPLLPGATPGMHFDHSEYYFRRIRFEDTSPYLPILREAGYPVTPCLYAPHTEVVTFPVKAAHFMRGKDDVSMWEQLEIASQLQTYWADNQVSVTITFKPEEAPHIKYALSLYETRLKGVSFLPADGGGYAQAPYETCTREQYEEAAAQLREYDLSTAGKNEVSEKFCDSDRCVNLKRN